MKNLMNRDEYLQKTNEGFITNNIKKGWEKIKSLFKIGMKKVKDFLAIFDNEGNVLPIVSPCAVIDKFSGSDAVEVYAPKELSQLTIEAGGNGCEEHAPEDTSEGDYEDAPEGSLEYDNFLSIRDMIGGKISESWEGVLKDRNSYTTDDEGFSDSLDSITYDKFEKLINDLLDERISGKNGSTKYGDGTVTEPYKNILVFGCPGIGKSTIPNMVIKKYNENVANGDPSKMVSLIKINCGRLNPGDLLMPTPPKAVDIIADITGDKEVFPNSNEYLDSLSSEESELLQKKIDNSAQYLVTDAPKSWLPAYKAVGGKFDEVQDARANSGIYKDKNGNTIRVGNGGIILLDELLRAPAEIFHELMNFLLERELEGWTLGSKWAIIACSNRPCDSRRVQETWDDWEEEPAEKERFAIKYLLIPEPESWMEYERKKWGEEGLGKIDIIFDFIFDKSSKIGQEYPRWISQVPASKKSKESAQSTPVSPRQWSETINSIKKYMKDNHINNILKLTPEQLDEAITGVIDKNLRPEFVMWFEDHCKRIDINMSIEEPTYFKLDDEVINDVKQSKAIINNLSTEIIEKFKDDPSKLDDDKLANIVIWMARNFKNDMRITFDFLEELISHIFKDQSDFAIVKYHKTMMMVEAAFPMNNNVNARGEKETFEDGINYCINRKTDTWPADSMDIIKGYMKEYFPWRIDGDKIKFYDDVDTFKNKE